MGKQMGRSSLGPGSRRRRSRLALGLLLGLGPALANPAPLRVTAAVDKTFAGNRVPCRAGDPDAPAANHAWSVWEGDREVPGACVKGLFLAPEADVTRIYRVRATRADGKASGEATIVVLPRNDGTTNLFKVMADTGWSKGHGASCVNQDLPFFDTETWTRYDAKASVLFSLDAARPRQVVGCGLKVPFRWDPALAALDGIMLSFRDGADVVRHNGSGQASTLIEVTGKVRDCYLETLRAVDRKANEWSSCLQSPDLRVRGLVPYAGNPRPGFEGHDDDQGLSARFRRPFGLAMVGSPAAGTGACVVTDPEDHVVRLVSMDGHVRTHWGAPGKADFVDGPGANARFHGPTFVAAQPLGNNPYHVGYTRTFAVADTGNHAIRVVDDTGAVTTLAGTGQAGFADADNPRQAQFNRPMGLVLDGLDNVFVADAGNRRIRRIDAQGRVTTLAGSGAQGAQDGQGQQATFSDLRGMASGLNGLLFVVDGHSIRMITSEGAVTTILGQVDTPGFRDTPQGVRVLGKAAAHLNQPCGIASFGAFHLAIADEGNHAVRLCTLHGLDPNAGGAPFVTLSTLAGDPGQKATRFGLLRDGLPWFPTEAYAAIEAPCGIVANGVGGFFATTGHALVELAEADLERSRDPFSILREPAPGGARDPFLRAKPGVPLNLTLQWFDGGTTPPDFTWTAACVPLQGTDGEVKLGEGPSKGRNLVPIQLTFPQAGTMRLRLHCITEQGVTEHCLYTVIVKE